MKNVGIHKRKPASMGSGFPRSVCGKPGGFTTHLWANVTCPSCKARKK